ncbi:VanZ family protein [Adhaeretor mobilis]|nr:VanZ family protein [Adhaeretor mobilis]
MAPLDRIPIDRLKRLAARARTLAIVYLGVLFLGTHLPLSISLPQTHLGPVSIEDKIVHLGLYALLTFFVLAGWELTLRRELQPKHYFAVWLVGTVYGMIDEITQIPVGRTGDMHDWLADVIGIVVGLVLFQVVRKKLYQWLSRKAPEPERGPGS